MRAVQAGPARNSPVHSVGLAVIKKPFRAWIHAVDQHSEQGAARGVRRSVCTAAGAGRRCCRLPATFGIDTATPAATAAQYGLGIKGLSSALAQNGVLRPSSVSGGQQSADVGSFVGDLTVDFDTNVYDSFGAENAALPIGNNNFVFHPGYPNGAFRIDGPSGHGNVCMGFTPSPSGMSHVNIVIQAATGLTTYTLRDSNLVNVFQKTFANTDHQAGVTVLGLSAGDGGTTYFDNVRITSSVPEPVGGVLLSSGLLTLCAAASRRQA